MKLNSAPGLGSRAQRNASVRRAIVFRAGEQSRLRSIIAVVTCGIAFAVSGFPVQAAQTTPDAGDPRPSISRQSCTVTAATDRIRCKAAAKPSAEERDAQCEDAINLQQRICMLEVLEALHPNVVDQNRPQTATQPR
jgi:hypothetical protein